MASVLFCCLKIAGAPASGPGIRSLCPLLFPVHDQPLPSPALVSRHSTQFSPCVLVLRCACVKRKGVRDSSWQVYVRACLVASRHPPNRFAEIACACRVRIYTMWLCIRVSLSCLFSTLLNASQRLPNTPTPHRETRWHSSSRITSRTTSGRTRSGGSHLTSGTRSASLAGPPLPLAFFYLHVLPGLVCRSKFHPRFLPPPTPGIYGGGGVKASG